MYHLSDLMLYVHSACASCVVIRTALCGFAFLAVFPLRWGSWMRGVWGVTHFAQSDGDEGFHSISITARCLCQIVQLSTACSIKNSHQRWTTHGSEAGSAVADNCPCHWFACDVLIFPLQWITNDPLPCRTSSSPHKSRVYIMKYL